MLDNEINWRLTDAVTAETSLSAAKGKWHGGGHKNHVSTQRIAHSIIKLQRDHFYLCQISVWTFYWTFFKATKWLREKKQTFLLSVQISER